jgi:orotate phosphoribosyltransferase
MIYTTEIAEQTAKYLLQVQAIKLSPTKPYKWASGWNSPIYCDNRVTLSYPQVRTFIRQEMCSIIQEKYGSADVIVGVATGAIAIGALVAEQLGLPFAYVRSQAKEHGLSKLIEGVANKGQTVIVIEDLISTGKSSLKAVEILRENGCIVKGMAAIFTYGFEEANKLFNEQKCELVTLSNYDTLIKKAFQQNFVTAKETETLKKWKESPSTWNN